MKVKAEIGVRVRVGLFKAPHDHVVAFEAVAYGRFIRP
jgi:hypothetical protein